MKNERKIIVSEQGKLVLKNIAMSFKGSDGKNLYLTEPETKTDKREKLYERIENNFLLIGLLKKVDLSDRSSKEVNDLMLKKHEKEERFLSAGRKMGFNLGLDIDPEDILRFYITLTPDERVNFDCKP
ncbi:hypothetical protein V7O66_01910 [Methanolobus sp. ZRKC3]|uniref:hypothetical protein n=1 Tax=Methanolobus sp. ZRKC3 TaxID=3125786 RepID=UPI0032548148